jgi:hypothetical protein
MSSEVTALAGATVRATAPEAHESVDVRWWQRDHPTVQFVPGARVRVYAGPFAGHEVDVIEPLRNNLIRVVVRLLDGPAGLDLSVLDLDPDAGGAVGAGSREPRRPLLLTGRRR